MPCSNFVLFIQDVLHIVLWFTSVETWSQQLRRVLYMLEESCEKASRFELKNSINIFTTYSEFFRDQKWVAFTFFFVLRQLDKSSNRLVVICCRLINESLSSSDVSLNLQSLCSFLNVDVNRLRSFKSSTVRNILIDVWLSDISPTILAHASLIFDLLTMKKTYLSFLDKPEIEFMLLYICLLPDWCFLCSIFFLLSLTLFIDFSFLIIFFSWPNHWWINYYYYYYWRLRRQVCGET